VAILLLLNGLVKRDSKIKDDRGEGRDTKSLFKRLEMR
jgi:hypothetical protein